MDLTNIIIQKIKGHGPVSFRDFMEMALYHPGVGYYMRAQEILGEKGDFFTSPYLTPAFGAMIAKQVEEMWQILGKEEFTIVEYGAGTGLLARDILDYIKSNDELNEKVSYCIIEKSPVMRNKQQQLLHNTAEWYDSIGDIGEINGCVLSHEVLDNFAVHQVIQEKELMEVFVTHENGFAEILKPATVELVRYFEELQVTLPEGFRTEINLQATVWLKEIASSLKKGYVITIDYGNVSTELYNSRRSSGTLVCFNKHTVSEDAYSNIGNQDITSHVNFSALYHWGLKYGLKLAGFTDQANFLLSLGFKNYLRETAIPGGNIMEAVRKESFLTKMLLLEMGSKFKVLIQSKDVPDHKLSGLKGLEIPIKT